MADLPRISAMSDTWVNLKIIMRGEIEKQRDILETPYLTQEQTAMARGEISGLRRLMKLVEPDMPDARGHPVDYNIVRAPQQD